MQSPLHIDKALGDFWKVITTGISIRRTAFVAIRVQLFVAFMSDAFDTSGPGERTFLWLC